LSGVGHLFGRVLAAKQRMRADAFGMRGMKALDEAERLKAIIIVQALGIQKLLEA
jgi:hypothetical protein